MSVGHDDVAVGRDRARGRTDEGVGAGLRDAGLAERQQHLAIGTELEQLEPAALRRRIVRERSAVARPEVAVAVLTESMRLHEHAVAEPAIDGARRVDVQNRRLRSVVQPRAALAVRDDADRGAGFDVAESRPIGSHAVRIRHRAGPRRIAAARLTRCRKRARRSALARRHGAGALRRALPESPLVPVRHGSRACTVASQRTRHDRESASDRSFAPLMPRCRRV